MRKAVLYCTFFILHFSSAAQRDYTQLVNPFIGTGGHGHTYPGASVPFGMMQLSPDTRQADWDGSSGYHYSDSVIYGFSHTHLSGTGIPDYCDVLFMPFVGEVKWDPKDYRSTFSHKNEKASPGYYEVLLDKGNIKAQLTTSARSGMHQYTFPQSTKQASVLIDLKWRDEVLDSWIEKVSPYELRGFRRSKSWAQNQYLYFCVKFDKPIKDFDFPGKNENDGYKKDYTGSLAGKNIQYAVSFDLSDDKTVRAKIGISAVSADGAKKNLDTEIKDWNFATVQSSAKAAWNKELSKIDVKGGTKHQQTVFYTALYHSFLAPNIFQDADGQYRGTDLKVHKATGFTNYSVFSLWDTYRAYHPLMSIINRKRTGDWINTFLAQYKDGGMLPVWELAGNETFCMIGYHSVPVIWDAYQKGIRGFDAELALNAAIAYAEGDSFGLLQYREMGYISNEKEHESVSKTLEYAYDDWCIAQLAKGLGKDSIYQRFIRRAQNYKNVFDPVSKHMRGKVGAMWYTPFDPAEINNFYTEGNSWHYSFAAPQDIATLIQLYGGKNAFAEKLNELFTTSSKTTGRDQADVTGLIGQYAQGNEPSHHMAYLFNYVGQPWRTQELVHRINKDFYTNAPDGLIGNEDCGQMSAWYLFSAMGLYPVTPGSGDYALGTPLFDEVIIKLENGKSFRITKKGSANAYYVASAKLNSKPHAKTYLLHSDVARGGNFEFSMSDKPTTWGTSVNTVPKSEINAHQIVPVPYAAIGSNKFREQMEVSLKSIDANAEIWYQLIQPNIRSRFVKYEKPFVVTESGEIRLYSKRGTEQSGVATQQLYRIPGDRSITVLSKVHPMYTAGGAEALIDGIIGTTNWKGGDWQSYFDTDFEAMIDLGSEKPISYVGVHVLQDVSPWILYPKEAIFFVSSDNVNFKEAGRIKNNVGQQMAPAEIQEMGTQIKTSGRYVKVKVTNGGQLPVGHESAGNPSHLFIDEVIIK